MDDPAALIRERVPVRRIPPVCGLRLHLVEAAGELEWVRGGGTPYWAYVWAGGAALARHVMEHPETVRGLGVLDLGAGSGVVGIAAAKAGAATVRAAETDPLARAAIGLNAAANGVEIEMVEGDLLDGDAPAGTDIVLCGDMLYERALAARVVPFLSRCREAGLAVLLGDPGRGLLPRGRVRFIAEYGTGSVDEDRDAATTPASIFAFE